jgi:hypothetical protein
MTAPAQNKRVSPSLTVTFRLPWTQIKYCGSGTLIDAPTHPAGRRQKERCSWPVASSISNSAFAKCVSPLLSTDSRK